MSLADQIIALQFGSTQLDDIRAAASKGEPDALLRYVYFCAWQGIRSDDYIPKNKKAAVFRQLVDTNMIEVSLSPPEPVKLSPYAVVNEDKNG